ncbi:MAG: LacI family transcriptional regulator [Cyclobacteriaceae bacterium]|jgi:LacI family transcriptional regulator
MQITIKDIAREVGVSASTVSRILNGKATQNKKLVQLVKQKAKELNYQVNTAAAGLRTNKTKLIGIVVPEINNDFFAEVLAGVEEMTEASGYNLLICQSQESGEKELKLIKSLISCNVEGILISISLDNILKDNVVSESIFFGKKVVLFDRIPINSTFPYVTIQDYEGAYKVTKHVLEQGRKKFIFHGFKKNLSNDTERLRGVKAALAEADINELEIVYSTDIAILASLIREGGFDALVCYNDDLASKDIVGLLKKGIRIPEQLAVTGFDNRSICELISPTLTTVNHSTKDIGRKAAEMLLSMLDSDKEVKSLVLPAAVIIRESTTFIQ